MPVFKGNGYISRGDNSFRIVFTALLKRVYPKRKEFVPKGKKLFPLRVDPFSEQLSVQESKLEVIKVVSLIKHNRK